MSKSWGDSAVLLVAAATATVTAAATYWLTKRHFDAQKAAIVHRQYQREKLLKEKTAKARRTQQADAPPSGMLLDDVQISKVYLWELEDLRKKFAPALVENTMKCLVSSPTRSMRSPILRGTPSSNSISESSHITSYNKLITDHECILADIVRKPNQSQYSVAYVRAGPRKYLHFDPHDVHACIVTCGGLCPGLNNVIREVVKTLYQIYGMRGKMYGIQGGYRGFYEHDTLPPVELTPQMVENAHHQGGTILGSSRGGFDLDKILTFIQKRHIKIVFVIGGDGTHRGAFRIHEGCMAHGLNVSVAAIPKTIDNDVDYIDHSFGFNSAVEAAQYAIRSAKTEAVCNLPNGIGIVKLMGRSAGFIAAHATMASSDVDLCLVPEVPIVLEGDHGCLPHLMRRVQNQGFAVVVVAEGAGEDVLGGANTETDASGNKKLPAIGEFMKEQITSYFAKHGSEATVKYIDPSYMVRSVAANAADSLYCMQLAQNAVHGAMAGYTGFSVGLCNNRMVFLPIPELVSTSPRSMNPRGRTWERVLALTRQPNTVEKLSNSDQADENKAEHYAPMLR